MAANVWLEINAPHVLYKNNPAVQEAMMMMQQQAQMQQQQESEGAEKTADAEHKRGLEKDAANKAGNMEIEALKNEGKVAGKSALSQVPIPR